MMTFILATDFDFIAYMSKMDFFFFFFWKLFSRQWRFWNMIYIVARQGILSSLELRVQFCLLVCCTYPSSSTVNKEMNLIDQSASLRVDARETQQ